MVFYVDDPEYLGFQLMRLKVVRKSSERPNFKENYFFIKLLDKIFLRR